MTSYYKDSLFSLLGISALALGALSACGEEPTGNTNSDNGITITGCVSDSDCVNDPAGPICNMDTLECEPLPPCQTHDQCKDSQYGPVCDAQTKVCVPLPLGHPIGWQDGSEDSVTFTEIYKPLIQEEAPDLGFHATRNELWVVNRRPEVDGVCTEATFSGPRCRSLAGYTTVIYNPGTPDQRVSVLEDGNSWHFMRRPPAIAMADDRDFFGTCGEAATGNFEDNNVNFIGPTLWSSDPDIYAKPSGGNGSHMDMLHATPWCMGIAHEKENIYWTFNGNVGSIDRYDFKMDHGPGADDHSDGEILRYAPTKFKRVENVPSHMHFNKKDKHLYIADTGNARIAKLDTTSGAMTGPFTPVYEPLAKYGFMGDATVTDVVPDGTLQQPSGLTIHDDIIYVTDHATSIIHAFDMQGKEVRRLETGLPAGSLAGLRVGPNGKMWFTNMSNGTVYRIDPK